MAARARWALRGAGVTAVLVVVTWALAIHVPAVERVDASVFAGFYRLDRHPRLDAAATAIAHLCNPFPYVLLAAVPLLIAMVRRRPRIVLATFVILTGANTTTELLKPALGATRPGGTLAAAVVGPGSWPSGHATAAMALAFSCVLASPGRLRPALATAGATFAVAVSFSFLTLGWHFPSDVLGGYLVATTWALAVIGVLYAAELRYPQSVGEEHAGGVSVGAALAPQVSVLAGVAGLACALALARPHAVLAFTRGHTAFLAGAAGIGILALALAGFIALTVRR